MKLSATPTCPLCLAEHSDFFWADRRRDYWQCDVCRLVFVAAHQHLQAAAERAIYDLHENHSDDPGYRRFLARLAEPVAARVKPSAQGLDYGCGPGPVLAEMLRQMGHTLAEYDPFYADDSAVLEQTYDFVTCSEVVEHFRRPDLEFQRLFGLLKPGGILGVMTKLVKDAQAFQSWHYKNDQTHISFFSPATLLWLAEQNQCQLEFIAADVVIFKAADSRA